MTIIAFQSGEATYQRMIVLFHGRNTHPTAGLVLRSFADETPSVIQIAWLKSQGLALFKAHFPLNATCFGKKKNVQGNCHSHGGSQSHASSSAGRVIGCNIRDDHVDSKH